MADSTTWDGRDATVLRALLEVPRIALFDRIATTMDVAHELGRTGAPAGTLVLAERQDAGRGRSGQTWQSDERAGIWMTLLERPNDTAALEVLSLRLGLAVGRVLERYLDEPVRLKWPNDVFAGGGKVAGILVETRWRDGRPDWVAIGLGVNVRRPPDVAQAAALRPGTSRTEVLAELIPAMRAAASARGPLTPGELSRYSERDLAAGRPCRQPEPGIVRGISASGALVVETRSGERAFRGGSLVLEEAVR